VFLIIIFSFQFYLLARLFKKNKIKVILSALGLYFLGNFMFGIGLFSLLALNIINIGFDYTQITQDNMGDFSTSLNQFLIDRNVPIISDVILFILIGVLYYNFLKKKWMKEVIVEHEPFIQEIKEQVTKIQHLVPVKTPHYLHFHDVNDKNIHLVPQLANEIWNVSYKDIISQEQIDYMLDLMYSPEKIKENLLNGEHWKILKADNLPVGYIHYKEEDDKVFLSKIYLIQDEKYKGLGQALLNEVIQFALDQKKNSIYLTVNKNNAKAIRFYDKNNFKNMKSETFDIGNGYIMDDFIFEKDLTLK